MKHKQGFPDGIFRFCSRGQCEATGIRLQNMAGARMGFMVGKKVHLPQESKISCERQEHMKEKAVSALRCCVCACRGRDGVPPECSSEGLAGTVLR